MIEALVAQAKVNVLQRAMQSMPQAGPDELQTDHFFAEGMYARRLFRKAGVLIVGKVHRREHFYIVTKGSVRVTTDSGVRVLCAGDVLVSAPGTKRACLALEDSVCMTVHRTDKKNLAKIEKELIENDPDALFDHGNKLRLIGKVG